MSSEERGSALLVLSLGVLVPLVWLAFGWRLHLLVGANDLSLLLLPAMRRLLAVAGDFDAFLYDPAWLGGSELRDILGELPLHRLLGAWPIDALTLLNATAFFVQVVYGHLAARSAHALCCSIEPAADGGGLSWPVQLLIGLLAAFAPIVAWRIAYGHLFILCGALALPAACALVLLARAGRLTMSCAAICLLALAHALPHVGQQPVLYGATFGLPLLAALIFTGPRGHALRASALLALACAAALSASLPVLTGLLGQFAGSDLPRGVRAKPVTYSYLVASARDWLGTLTWALPSWTGRPHFAWHETNYPLGALVLASALWPRRVLGRGVPIALGSSCALVLAFSMDLRPLSSLLLWLVPPLQWFRVPARAALPLLLAVYPLLLGLLVGRLPGRVQRNDALVLLPFGLLICVLPGIAREVALWSGVGLVVLAVLRRPERAPSSLALLAVLALASAFAFQERLLSFPTREELIERPARIGEQLRRELPELRSPLVRSVGAPDPRPNNTLYALGLSSVSGYNLLNERMLRLYCALLGVPYQSGVSIISVDSRADYFPKLAALYNIVARVDLRAVRLAALPRSGSALWFSEGFVTRGSFDELVQRLDATELRRLTPIVSSDRAARALPRVECHSEPHDIPYSTGSGPRIVSVQLAHTRSSDCPLTVALNYSGDLRAYGRAGSGAWSPLRTYPAYGALLGVVVPRDIRELEVRMDPQRPIGGSASVWVGVMLAAGLLVYARRSQRRIARV